MAYQRFTMDGTTYRVRIVYDTYADSFELVEGTNRGDMLNDRHERDLIGTRAVYEMGIEPDPKFPEDFDALYAAMRAPVPSHSVTVFDGQGTLTYDAQIQRGRRVYKGILGGVRQYGGSVFQFIPSEPQWRPTT